MIRLLLCFALMLSVASIVNAQNDSAGPSTDQSLPGFESRTAAVNSTKIHYMRGGTGPAVILLHGFPEDWYEFRLIMPRLAKKFTVIAVDLRGIGESEPATTGFDAPNMAEDIHQLVANLGLQRVYVFGHDIGGMVAYAFARRYPQSARGVMILDVAFPGMDPWQDIVGRPPFWHIRFHQTALPERLVAGRQSDYFRYFLRQHSDADVAHYAHAYRDPDHLSAAFETYRAFPANAEFFAAQRSNLDLPIVIGSGERDAFAEFLPRIAAAMRAHGCTKLNTEFVKGAAHYVAEEQPDAVAELIERYAAD